MNAAVGLTLGRTIYKSKYSDDIDSVVCISLQPIPVLAPYLMQNPTIHSHQHCCVI